MKTAIAAALASLMLATSGCGHAAVTGTPTALAAAAVAAYAAADAPEAIGPLPARFAEVVNTHQDLIFRGGVPDDDHLKLLCVTGVASQQAPGALVTVKTIVNLLDPTSSDGPSILHEQAVAKAAHVNFVNIPLPWGSVTPTAMVQKWFTVVLQARANHTALYIHCTHGRDRTGSMVAVYREQYDTWKASQALDEMEAVPFDYAPAPYPWITQFVDDFKPLGGRYRK